MLLKIQKINSSPNIHVSAYVLNKIITVNIVQYVIRNEKVTLLISHKALFIFLDFFLSFLKNMNVAKDRKLIFSYPGLNLLKT